MNVDFVVIGGGIAGAACAYCLSEAGSVVLLEREDGFGYHATGRSAALFSEYFGCDAVRWLTKLSRGFLEAPPAGFEHESLLSPRGVVALVSEADMQVGRFDAALAAGRDALAPAFEMPLEEARIRCPILAPHGYVKALCRPSVMDIDVDALHQGQLRRIRARGGVVMRGTPVRTIAREATTWRVEAAGDHRFVARHVVNAAGAWADEVALMAGVQPIGLVPKRRTAVLIDLPDDVRLRASLATWPMVTNLADTFYFKPESGRLMACPSDETPLAPCDVQPEELDVATAVARIEEVTTLQVRRVTHKWAGLRSVVADEAPVLGEAPDAPGFFWAAALGGFGIQSAPATGRAVATLVATGRLPDDMRRADFNEATLSPARLRRRVARRLEFD